MYKLLNNRENLSKKVNRSLGLKHLKVRLKSFKSDFITILIFTILGGFFLDSIIRQMNIFIGAILETKLKT